MENDEMRDRLASGELRLEPVGLRYDFRRMLGLGGVDLDEVVGAAPTAQRAAEAWRKSFLEGTAPGMEEAVLWPRIDSNLKGTLWRLRLWETPNNRFTLRCESE